MFTPSHPINGVTVRRRSLQILSATTIAATVLTLISVGCGGSGGGSTTTTPSPTASPSKSPSPSPSPSASPLSAKQRAIAMNFVPNYVPTTPSATVPYLHWASNKNITVFIRPAVNNLKDNRPSTTIDAATIKSYVTQGLIKWTQATDSDFTFTYVDSSSKADIDVVFVDQVLHSDNTPASGLVGLTYYQFTNPSAADLIHGTLNKSTAQVLMSQLTVANIVDTTTHELGHSLGIIQHSPDNADLMFFQSIPPPTITQRDQNTVFFLYYSNTALGKAQPIPANGSKPVMHSGEVE